MSAPWPMAVPLAGLAAAAAGAVGGGLAACVPGLHITLVSAAATVACASVLPFSAAWVFTVSATGSYVVLSGLPAVHLDAPDDSTAFAGDVMARYAAAGRRHDAFLLTAAGSACGLLVACAAFLAMTPEALSVARRLLAVGARTAAWIGLAVAAAALSLPVAGATPLPRGRWRAAARCAAAPLASAAAFAACGLLGLAVCEAGGGWRGAQTLLVPCWAGLFAVPGLVVAVVLPPLRETPRTGISPPLSRRGRDRNGGERFRHDPSCPELLSRRGVARGVAAGVLAGAATAIPGFAPALSAAAAGGLAGPCDPVRLLASGAAKAVALAVGPLLAAAGWGSVSIATPAGWRAMACTVTAFLAGGGLALMIAHRAGISYGAVAMRRRRAASALFLGVVAIVAAGLGGLTGILILAASAGVGLAVLLWDLNRVCLLGVILAPAVCRLSGYAPLFSIFRGV